MPAIALGMEDVEKDIMDKKPKPKDEGLFAHGYGIRIVLQGFMFGILSLLAFRIGEVYTGSIEGGRTMAFIVLALSQVVQSFNMRSEHSLFTIGVFTNKKLNIAALSSLILVALVVFIPPLAGIFGLITLTWKLYIAALLLVLLPFPVMELCKAIGLVAHHKS